MRKNGSAGLKTLLCFQTGARGSERCLMSNKSRANAGVCLQRVLALTVRVVGRGGHDDTGQAETQAATQEGAVLPLLQTARV